MVATAEAVERRPLLAAPLCSDDPNFEASPELLLGL